jgi:hypothetical protein
MAVAQDGGALYYVPGALRTAQLCRIAVAQDGLALDGVPDDLRTEDLCRTAVAQDGRALECATEHLHDRIGPLIPPPVPAWDISLLDELVNILDAASSPAPLETPHA